jgi:hypothetical protein
MSENGPSENGPVDGEPIDDDTISLDAPFFDRDRDGVDSLRDVESEQGDEAEVNDLFVFDETAARELDIDFTGDQRDEPTLD